jgi:hypothetical protein
MEQVMDMATIATFKFSMQNNAFYFGGILYKTTTITIKINPPDLIYMTLCFKTRISDSHTNNDFDQGTTSKTIFSNPMPSNSLQISIGIIYHLDYIGKPILEVQGNSIWYLLHT